MRLSMTQKQFADAIGFSAGQVVSVERARRVPSLAFAKACDRVTGVPGTFSRWQPFVKTARYPAYFAPNVEYEQAATAIHTWDLGVVPGLLQTRDYAKAISSAGQPSAGKEEIDQIVDARIDRQEILSQRDGPLFWSVIHEGVLHHVIGSRQLMAAQLSHLLDMTTQPRIIIQVMPYTASDHPGGDGPIVVYDFKEKPSMGYTEAWGGGRIVEDQHDVTRLMTAVNLLRAASLSPNNSHDFIREIRSEFE